MKEIERGINCRKREKEKYKIIEKKCRKRKEMKKSNRIRKTYRKIVEKGK